MSNPTTWTVTCRCGKRSYTSRRAARRVARVTDRAGHMHEYQCSETGDWHVAHLHPAALAGRVAR